MKRDGISILVTCLYYMIEAKPENLIGDRAYDSDPLDEELQNDGIEMRRTVPTAVSRTRRIRRRLSHYMNAGWSSASSPGYKCNVAAHDFLGFVQLGVENL
jgi:hypothetical protein